MCEILPIHINKICRYKLHYQKRQNRITFSHALVSGCTVYRYLSYKHQYVQMAEIIYEHEYYAT